jgi:hypothetical protein
LPKCNPKKNLARVPSAAEAEEKRSAGSLGLLDIEVNRRLKGWLIINKKPEEIKVKADEQSNL